MKIKKNAFPTLVFANPNSGVRDRKSKKSKNRLPLLFALTVYLMEKVLVYMSHYS
jgi:hypothetical protein